MADANELLRRCQRSDQAALEQLMAMLSGRVFRLAFQMLGDAGLAEEATADSFVKLWLKCRQWRGDSSATTWIYRIAYRTIVDRRRSRRSPWQVPGETLPDPRPGPIEQIAERDLREHESRQLEKAMGELADADRALVHLHYFEELKLSEIALVMGVARDALKMRLFRAREQLRRMLERETDA